MPGLPGNFHTFTDGIPLKWETQKSYEIRLEHVFFRYPNASEDTLKDINFTLHPGEKLANGRLKWSWKNHIDPADLRLL